MKSMHIRHVYNFIMELLSKFVWMGFDALYIRCAFLSLYLLFVIVCHLSYSYLHFHYLIRCFYLLLFSTCSGDRANKATYWG